MLFNRCLSVGGGVVKLCNNYLSPTAAAAVVQLGIGWMRYSSWHGYNIQPPSLSLFLWQMNRVLLLLVVHVEYQVVQWRSGREQCT